MNQNHLTRLIVIGQVEEAGVRPQFDRHLEELRAKYAGLKAVGEEKEIGAFLLALALFVAEVQDDV